MTKLRNNLAANLVSRGWTALLSLIFVPFYLRILGVEAYGLIGFFATLQSLSSLIDMGLGLTLNREMARLSAVPGQAKEQRVVLRTLESLYWIGSLLVGIGIIAASKFVAAHWIKSYGIAIGEVATVVRFMGVVIAMQLPCSFYQGGLLGLQRQALSSGIIAGAATLRGAGAVLILWKISPTIEAFFAWQAAVSIIQVVVTRGLLLASMPPANGHIGFQATVVRRVWRYAIGVSGTSLLGAGLTQSDKLLLSAILPLSSYGYYTLAGTVASVLWTIIVPINTAFFPRFAQLVETRDEAELGALYHRASQFIMIVLLPIAATAALFAWEIVLLWTGNSVTADRTAFLITLLVVGTALNGIVSVPATLQAAAGWPQLMMYSNMIAACVLVPGILVLSTRYGAEGAAFAWVVLNAGYLLFSVPAMHRRLLKEHLVAWYVYDVGLPILAIGATGLLLRKVLPDPASTVWISFNVLCTWAVLMLAGVVVTPSVRSALKLSFPRLRQAF